MMSREDVLKQIALITGKKYEPTTEVSRPLHTTSRTDDRREDIDESDDEVLSISDDDQDILGEVEDEGTDERMGDGLSSPPQDGGYSDEIKTYVGLFAAKQVVNNKILDGRAMTRKEYLKYTKGLSKTDLYKHPLLYKMFRSEEQMEGNFHSWCDKFGDE